MNLANHAQSTPVINFITFGKNRCFQKRRSVIFQTASFVLKNFAQQIKQDFQIYFKQENVWNRKFKDYVSNIQNFFSKRFNQYKCDPWLLDPLKTSKMKVENPQSKKKGEKMKEPLNQKLLIVSEF